VALLVLGLVAAAAAGMAVLRLSAVQGPQAPPSVASIEPTAPASVASSARAPIRIGAVFPATGDAGALAAEELRGIQIAVDLSNAEGGVDGVPNALDIHEIDAAAQAPAALDAMKADGVEVVMGAYSSELSIPVSAMVSERGMVYWETGAVADRLTGRGLPNVFRAGASSTTLGTDSGTFALQALAPMLGRAPSALRVALVSADDNYATEVAAAAYRTLAAGGASVVAKLSYPVAAAVFGSVLHRLGTLKPDVIVLASHIPDGIAFRQQMLSAGLHTGALIGTTMAECVPDFAAPLGADAVGIFGSDRPSGAFNPSALSPDARALYDQFAEAFGADDGTTNASSAEATAGDEWAAGRSFEASATDGQNEIGESALEEGVSGFSAAWALFHDVLPAAASSGTLSLETIAAAARAVDLPSGSLPNGGGLHFSSDPATLGQNELAIGLIQQWQAQNQYAVVWPATFATAPIQFVPLPR
jgi:branched-chain amino acid transport system substrate-binding protein